MHNGGFPTSNFGSSFHSNPQSNPSSWGQPHAYQFYTPGTPQSAYSFGNLEEASFHNAFTSLDPSLSLGQPSSAPPSSSDPGPSSSSFQTFGGWRTVNSFTQPFNPPQPPDPTPTTLPSSIESPSATEAHDGFASYDPTLNEISATVDRDVEMSPPAAEIAQSMVFLVLDTNILLHYFDVLKTFAQNIERLAIPIVLLIPGQVIYELDKQKDMQDMKWNARRASSWLLEQLQKGGKGAKFKYIRGQATRETCKASGNWKVLNGPDTNYTSDMKKDENILDCCMYFRRQHVTVLCSNDNNLCILAQNENSERQHGEHDLSVIKPPKQKWSSQQLMAQLARLIPFDISSLSGFNTTDSHYKNLESIREEEEIVDDSMDVDDDSTLTAEIMQPTDAADSLHLEVVGHFSILLRQLVARVAKDEIINLPKTPSRHAPKWHVSLGHAGTDDWTASDCIDFFEDKKKPGDVRWSRVRSFLSPPYSRTVRGTRPGKDWSRMDWTEVLRALQKIGEAWDEPTFDQSVGILEPHFTAVMDRVLRP